MRILDTTTLGRTATVVRKRSNIDDLRNLNARGIDGTDSTLTAITRTLNVMPSPCEDRGRKPP